MTVGSEPCAASAGTLIVRLARLTLGISATDLRGPTASSDRFTSRLSAFEYTLVAVAANRLCAGIRTFSLRHVMHLQDDAHSSARYRRYFPIVESMGNISRTHSLPWIFGRRCCLTLLLR